jgi:glycosyltransferase involved in cell wall biosynthesis
VRLGVAGETATLSPAEGEGVVVAGVPLGRVDLAISRVRDSLRRADCAVIRLPSLMGSIAVAEARYLGLPYAVEIVGCIWDALVHHGKRSALLAAPVGYAVTRASVLSAPYAIYVSNEFLQRRYPCRGVTEACSDVVVDALEPAVLDARLRSILEMRAVPRRPIRLGLVGSLDVDYKGHETALLAAAEMRRGGLDVRLSFLGRGGVRRWAKRAEELGVMDCVSFDGSLPAGQPVRDWMDGLDVFVIPSLQEGLPRALVEAMSRGLPAVGSRVGGVVELIEPEMLHAAKDSKGLAALISSLLEKPGQLEMCATRNFDVARGYQRSVLDERRDRFWHRFCAYAGVR